ncbi:MAG: hypothetical protein ACOYUZ_01920 [Patescibacteria group bacterium]
MKNSKVYLLSGLTFGILAMVFITVGLYFGMNMAECLSTEQTLDSLRQDSGSSTILKTQDAGNDIQDVDADKYEDPISYEISSEKIEVFKGYADVDYTLEYMQGLAMECGVEHQAGYLEDLVSKYKDQKKMIFEFRYSKDSTSRENIYYVTVLPNVMKYQNMDEFKKDFDICAAGGKEYPKMMNEEWLVFESACGAVAYDPELYRMNGCQFVKEEVGPTLDFN